MEARNGSAVSAHQEQDYEAQAETSNAGSAQQPSQPFSHEIEQARASLKTALLQLGLVLRFHRDVRTLGVNNYASKAPGSLTRPLEQALKGYNDACNSMEDELMRARQVIESDLERGSPNASTSSPAIEAVKNTKSATSTPGPPPMENMTVDSTIEATRTSDEDTNKPTHAKEAAIVIDDDEMEDLFGPNTGRTDSSNATPAAAQPQQQPPSQTEQPSAHQIADAARGDIPPYPMGNPTDLAPFADFPGTSLSTAEPGNYDFSAMSTNDFNSLLSGFGPLSSSGTPGDIGAEGSSGIPDALNGLNLADMDFSNFGNLFGSNDAGTQQPH